MTTYATYEEKKQGLTGSDVAQKTPRKMTPVEVETVTEINKLKNEIRSLGERVDTLMNTLPYQEPICGEVILYEKKNDYQPEKKLMTIIVDRPMLVNAFIKERDFEMKAATTKADLKLLGMNS